MHTCRAGKLWRALLAQALRDLQAVHRVRPVKVRGHQPGLVALDGPDAVPLQGQVLQQRDFSTASWM
jgi:hypothetical protein